MILQIGISSILLKLLIEEERVDAIIVTNEQNSRELDGMTNED